MSGKTLNGPIARRNFLTHVGVGAGASILGAAATGSPAMAADAAEAPWQAARHAQDDWYDKVPGVHRFLFDSASAEGMGWALQFSSNYYTANQQAYGLKDSDLAVIIVARHKATSFAYNDTMWAKYGKAISEQADYLDPKTKEPPKFNIYGAQGDTVQAGRMEALIKKGTQFAVCGMSSRRIATLIAKAYSLDVDAVFKEISANLIPNSHLVPAGILAVNRAQEHGYSFIFAT